MFCDLVGSTALSARLDPEDLREVIGAYHGCVADVVGRHGGFVAKYMGDGALVYFGYPQAHENEAERAVHAGLELVEAVSRLTVSDGTPLAARVSIASGLVVVGDLIGEGAAREEAVVGETPNLAARLQALAEPGSVVVAPSVRRLAGAAFEYADLGEQRLKGFGQPVQIARVLRSALATTRFEARRLTGLTPLIGREGELALLQEQWVSAKAGHGRVVLISGEPGIGKSRLVQALLDQLSDKDCELLPYQCSSYFANTPLYPVVERLERVAGIRRDDAPETKLARLEGHLGETSSDAARIIPLVADLLSIPASGRYPLLPPSPQKRRDALLEALVDDVSRRAARQPVLINFEDAHWIDPTSLDFLNRLVGRVPNERILLLITFRPEFTPPWPSNNYIAALALGRLSQEEGRAIAHHVTAGQPLPAEVMAQIVERTDGVPLFVEELTKTVVESPLLRNDGRNGTFLDSLPRLLIPETLQD
ncbi:MAG TPA: AAA family ATPase, partial [Herpetosiphonaceae bacterium]|nr:AAA family ATPase [Herpetosiphonaceae bacterium]